MIATTSPAADRMPALSVSKEKGISLMEMVLGFRAYIKKKLFLLRWFHFDERGAGSHGIRIKRNYVDVRSLLCPFTQLQPYNSKRTS